MADSTQTFSRSERLLNWGQYRAVFQQHHTTTSSKHWRLFISENQLAHARLGIAIAKKSLKNATDRNRLKRIAREYFRLNKATLAKQDYLLTCPKKLPYQRTLKGAILKQELVKIFHPKV